MTIQYTTTTANTQSASIESGVFLENTLLVSRVLGNHDFNGITWPTQDDNTYTIGGAFSCHAGNILGEFEIEFPKLRRSLLDHARLNDVAGAICKLRSSVEKCPEYLAIMGMFSEKIAGPIPHLKFAFDNHYLEAKPYCLKYLGWPNIPCVLALGHGSTTRNTSRFVNHHLHRIGNLASQWLYVVGYL